MKTLNFLWLQGEDAMTPSGKANVLAWRILNPTWQVTVWSQDMIREFIRAHCPVQMLHAWDEIANAKVKEVKNTYGKLSDFGRLLICHYNPAEWNAYADDDCEPFRPLDEWMADTEWGDHQLRTRGTFVKPEKMNPIDWSKINVVFSGENHNNRNVRLSINNNFMMARPSTEILKALIPYCVSRRKDIVLRAFGPWALTDFYYTVRDRVRLLGLAVLPWHYANWIPREMGDQPHPEWLVMKHHQEMRWTDKSSPEGWLGGGNRKITIPRLV